MKKITFGILGPGKISHRFMKGIAHSTDGEVIAVVSRSLEKAREYQSQYGLKYAYDDYEAFLNNPEMDAVYIATPSSVHYDMVMLCLKHGKHVLCEKPFLSSSADIRECFAYARERNLFLMEAQKCPFTFLNREVLRQIQEGAIGEVKYIEASYCYDTFARNYDHWVFRYEDGGGMFDVGVYAIAYANMMASSKIKRIQGMVNRTPTGCDGFAVAMLEYENGVKAVVKGALELKTENKAMIYGTKGYIETFDFWKNTGAMIYRDQGVETLTVEMPTDFYPQIEHAIRCIRDGRIESDVMSEAASLEIMKVLEYIRKI